MTEVADGCSAPTHTPRWALIPTAVAGDPNLSHGARGLYAFLIAHPEVPADAVAIARVSGRDRDFLATCAALQELEAAGHYTEGDIVR